MTVNLPIVSLEQLDLAGIYSYADYLRWTFAERVELIRGRIFKMTPAPSMRHQVVSAEINDLLRAHIKKNPCGCHVFYAPFDVRLPKPGQTADDEVLTVVQPDLCVVCDAAKLSERGCLGAPDLVVEILSPGNSQRELHFKFELYEEAGVPEYWTVDPGTRSVTAYRRDADNRFAGRPYTEGSVLPCGVLPGLNIDVEAIFGGFGEENR